MKINMKISTILTLLTCLSLAACQQANDTPTQVAEKYWHALKNGDIDSAKNLVAESTQAELDRYLALPQADRIALGDISFGTEQTTVTTLISEKSETVTNQSEPVTTDIHHEFQTVLVLENGQWKIDAARTQLPAAKKPDESATEEELSDSLQKNLESMDQALEQGADMLREFMQQGSEEMSESLLKGMNKMNETLREAIEKMQQRREQQQAPTPPDDEQGGEGLI